jgi:hypothetical protein
MRARWQRKWRHLGYWVVGAVVAAATLIVTFDRPDIECSRPVWNTVDGICTVEFTLQNRTPLTSTAVVIIRAFRTKSSGKGARTDYLAANRLKEIEMLPMGSRVVSENLDVGGAALKHVEVEVRVK